MTLSRSVQVVQVTYISGGHGHMEQPLGAMSWEESCMQDYITQGSCICCAVAACQVGRDWGKYWLFASTYAEMETIASQCPHPQGSRQNFAGKTDAHGRFLSKLTAAYPPKLCEAIAGLVSPLVSRHKQDVRIESLKTLLPIKAVESLPFARQDGGGFTSQADWSSVRAAHGPFAVLRKNWMNHIISHQFDKQVFAMISAGHDGPPLSDQDLTPLRAQLEEFLLSQGVYPDWSIPPDQPMCLFILQAWCNLMNDADESLCPYLIAGVPLGIEESITASNCFPRMEPSATPEDILLPVHRCNCQSAESEPEIVQELIDKEVAEAWADVFQGILEDAREAFTKGLAIS